jgi:hypothetical protein
MPQSNAVGFDGSGGFGGAFYAAFKHTYGPKRIEPLIYNNNPLFQKIRKVDDFEGDSYMHTIAFEDPDNGSTNIATALTQTVNPYTSLNAMSQTARFAIWRGREYQALNLAAEEVRASRSDAGSLLRKKDYETRRVLKAMGRRIDMALHNGGAGVLASFTTAATAGGSPNGTTLAGNTIQLDVNAMCTRFAVGQVIQVASTNNIDGSQNTLMNAGATATITGIQRSTVAGIPTTIQLNGGTGTLSSVFALTTSTAYYILRNGDNVGFGQNVLNGGICGLKCWLPAPPPVGTALTTRIAANDAFWGFNRNADVQRLAGCAYQAQPGEKFSVSFQNAGQELYVNGGGNEPGKMLLLVAPSDYTGYSLELGPQVRYADTNTASSGFRDLMVRTQAGDMTLTADPQLEPGLFYMLDLDALYLKSLDNVPHIDEQDGLMGLRLSSSDAQQIRWRAWYQLILDEPGRCLVGRCV